MKQVPEAAYIVPLGTKVRAIADGIVVGIKQQDTGDYEMSIVKPESPSWTFGYDHIDNLLVKEGDHVSAGQVLGEVSDYNHWVSDYGYGVIEIALAFTRESFIAHCPFLYLDESVKQNYYEKITALYRAWETFMGNTSIYDEDKYEIPGCFVKGPLDQ